VSASCVHVNAVAGSVMLQLYIRYDFYNMSFKMKHKLYAAFWVCTVPPPSDKLWVHTCCFKK